MQTKDDPVQHPMHYTQGIECLDFIESHKMSFCQGNAVKYLTRYKLKGTPIQDLEKARFYLDRLIDEETKLLNEKIENKFPNSINVPA